MLGRHVSECLTEDVASNLTSTSIPHLEILLTTDHWGTPLKHCMLRNHRESGVYLFAVKLAFYRVC